MAVLPFTPRGNATDACSGIAAFQASRPPVSDALRYLNLATYLFHLSLYSATLIVLWFWRDKPRFRKVRPFSLTFLCLLGFAVYNTASFMSPVYPLPCALVAFCYFMSLSWFGCLGIVRGLAITVETLYMKLAEKEKVVAGNKQGDDGGASSVTSGSISTLSYAAKIWFLLKLANGLVKVSDLNLSELVFTKNSYITLFILSCIPAFLVCCVLMAVIPPYQSCSDCEVFLEIPITFSVMFMFYSIVATRPVIVALQTAGWDEKGVIKELMFVPVVVVPMVYCVWILMIVDPSEIGFNRQFNWSWLFGISTFLYWVALFGYQIYVQWTDDRADRQLARVMEIKSFTQADPSTKEEFYTFASKQYVTESLQFMEDVAAYKQFFYDKAETWRMSKFKSLVETYVQPGSRLEINVSYGARNKIIAVYDRLFPPARSQRSSAAVVTTVTRGAIDELFDVFGDSLKEVEEMINHGVWLEFMRRREFKTAGGAQSALVAAATTTTGGVL